MSALATSSAASPSSAPITSYPLLVRYSTYISRASVKTSTTRTRARSVTESLALKDVIEQHILLHRTSSGLAPRQRRIKTKHLEASREPPSVAVYAIDP